MAKAYGQPRGKHPYVMAPWELVQASGGLSDKALRLWLILEHHARGDRRAWPSRRRMAELMGVRSLTTVDTHLRELLEAGLVERVEVRQHKSTVYLVGLPGDQPAGGGVPADWEGGPSVLGGGSQPAGHRRRTKEEEPQKKNPPTPQRGVAKAKPKRKKIPKQARAMLEIWNQERGDLPKTNPDRCPADRLRLVKRALLDEPDLEVWRLAFRAAAADEFYRETRRDLTTVLRNASRWLDGAAAGPALDDRTRERMRQARTSLGLTESGYAKGYRDLVRKGITLADCLASKNGAAL